MEHLLVERDGTVKVGSGDFKPVIMLLMMLSPDGVSGLLLPLCGCAADSILSAGAAWLLCSGKTATTRATVLCYLPACFLLLY
ncbi:MAG: hypothetical protein KA757_00050 [Vogesella sp.]|nr:hypothetical protein [Vogesella sp.]